MGQPTKAAVFFQCHFWVHAYYKKISYSHLGGKQGDYVARKKWAFFGIMCKHSKLLWSAIYCMLSCSHITKMAPAGPVSTMFDFDNFALTICIFFSDTFSSYLSQNNTRGQKRVSSKSEVVHESNPKWLKVNNF